MGRHLPDGSEGAFFTGIETLDLTEVDGNVTEALFDIVLSPRTGTAGGSAAIPFQARVNGVVKGGTSRGRLAIVGPVQT